MIPGVLDMAALARLHFHTLGPDQQADGIRRMAACGHGDHTVARATGLSVEQVRRILGQGAAA